MAGNFFKGTSTEQDARFGDKQRKLILSKQWPEIFDMKVDIKKVDGVAFTFSKDRIGGYQAVGGEKGSSLYWDR